MIYFIGDVHGHFDHVIEIVRRDMPAAIIFLGDLDCSRPLHEIVAPIHDLSEVWWIPGNHDADRDQASRNLFDSEFADRNLHGRVAVIDGLRVGGLGGVFRGDIWYPTGGNIRHESHDEYIAWLTRQQPTRLRASVPLSGKARKHRTSIFHSDYVRLAKQQADILVTHEAPSCHPNGFAVIDELARSMAVKKTFHGHQHDNLDYQQHRTALGFQAFGVGFCGIADQDGNVIRAGDYDEARRR